MAQNKAYEHPYGATVIPGINGPISNGHPNVAGPRIGHVFTPPPSVRDQVTRILTDAIDDIVEVIAQTAADRVIQLLVERLDIPTKTDDAPGPTMEEIVASEKIKAWSDAHERVQAALVKLGVATEPTEEWRPIDVRLGSGAVDLGAFSIARRAPQPLGIKINQYAAGEPVDPTKFWGEVSIYSALHPWGEAQLDPEDDRSVDQFVLAINGRQMPGLKTIEDITNAIAVLGGGARPCECWMRQLWYKGQEHLSTCFRDTAYQTHGV